MPLLLEGKSPAEEIKSYVARWVGHFEKSTGKQIGLAVILVGENPSSMVYVQMKERACKKVGISSFQINMSENSSTTDIIDTIERLNRDENVHGILLQLPLPKPLDATPIIERISPHKDVDGFHPFNLGRIFTGVPLFYPCTPFGIVALLNYYGIEVAGKDICIVGRSIIVGKPLSMLLLNLNSTVTLCHTKTEKLEEKTRSAEILIVAAGNPHFIKGDMVKEGAVVVDVGVNRIQERIVGDVDFDGVKDKVAAISPVPGGVGPMTIATLLINTLISAFRKEGLEIHEIPYYPPFLSNRPL